MRKSYTPPRGGRLVHSLRCGLGNETAWEDERMSWVESWKVRAEELLPSKRGALGSLASLRTRKRNSLGRKGFAAAPWDTCVVAACHRYGRRSRMRTWSVSVLRKRGHGYTVCLTGRSCDCDLLVSGLEHAWLQQWSGIGAEEVETTKAIVSGY